MNGSPGSGRARDGEQRNSSMEKSEVSVRVRRSVESNEILICRQIQASLKSV